MKVDYVVTNTDITTHNSDATDNLNIEPKVIHVALYWPFSTWNCVTT